MTSFRQPELHDFIKIKSYGKPNKKKVAHSNPVPWEASPQLGMCVLTDPKTSALAMML